MALFRSMDQSYGGDPRENTNQQFTPAEYTLRSSEKGGVSGLIFGMNSRGEFQIVKPGEKFVIKNSELHRTINGRTETLRLPLEILKLQTETKDDPTNRVRAALAAYEEIKKLGYRDILPYTRHEQLWALDKQSVDHMANQFHESYQLFNLHHLGLTEAYRQTYTEQPNFFSRLLKRNDQPKPIMVDLLNTSFADLPPHWQEVNRNSVRNILMILQQFSKAGLFDRYPNDKHLSLDRNMIFRINSALFAVWSRTGETDKNNHQRNPLFYGRTYQNFAEIRDGREPTEGWPAFLAKYRRFIVDNKYTYARFASLDLNGNQVLEQSELGEPRAVNTMIRIVRDEAQRELQKDEFLMAMLLENSGIVAKSQPNRRTSQSR
jgi:hypothetical protein